MKGKGGGSLCGRRQDMQKNKRVTIAGLRLLSLEKLAFLAWFLRIQGDSHHSWIRMVHLTKLFEANK